LLVEVEAVEVETINPVSMLQYLTMPRAANAQEDAKKKCN
jgi:hypothetical protein